MKSWYTLSVKHWSVQVAFHVFFYSTLGGAASFPALWKEDPSEFIPKQKLSWHWNWPKHSKSGELKRKVFSIWSSRESGEQYTSPVIRNIEFVLNHMGVTVEYRDIDTEKLPDPHSKAFQDRYLGVISFFDNEKIPESQKLLKWLTEFGESGLPWVSLGQFGFLEKAKNSELRKLFRRFGVNYTGYRDYPYYIQVEYQNERLMEFERVLDKTIGDYPPVLMKQSRQVELGVRLNVEGAPSRSTPVFISPQMSLAYGAFGLHSYLNEGRRMWQVNPFRFLRKAFNLDPRIPIPGISVANGRRVYYAHIDGDAFMSVSRVKGEGGKSQYCGEVMDQKIFKHYAFLPFGVSLIVSEVSPEHRGNKRLFEAARKAMEPPNVEVASHTFTHPLYWGRGISVYPVPGKKFDNHFETVGSIQWLQKNMSHGKPANVVYWSGDCMPKQEAFDHLAEANLYNLNGGDSQFDFEYPTLSFVSPNGRWMKEKYQVFTSNSNDNIYTNGWEGPYFGFWKTVETFKRTASPVILRPANPYFHFYSAERQVGVNAVVDSVEYALSNEITPVFPERYVRSVLGYNRTQIKPLGSGKYLYKGTRDLHTLRVDAPQDGALNLEKSKGVLGYRTLNGSLYLHLANVNEVKVVFEKSKKATRPYLQDVGGLVENYSAQKSTIQMTLSQFARGPLRVAGLGKRKQIRVKSFENEVNVAVNQGVAEIPFSVKPQVQRLEIKL